MTPQQVWSAAYQARYGVAPTLGHNDVSAITVIHDFARVKGKDADRFVSACVEYFCPPKIIPTTPTGPADPGFFAADTRRMERMMQYVQSHGVTL